MKKILAVLLMLLFVSTAEAQQAFQVNGLQSTGAISGPGTGLTGVASSLTAGNATNVQITASTGNAAYPLMLSPSATSGQLSPLMGTGLTFNPNTSTMSVPNTFTLTSAAGNVLGYGNGGDSFEVTGGSASAFTAAFIGVSGQTAQGLLICPQGSTCSPQVAVEGDGSLYSNKACASGFTRIGPNLCLLTPTGSISTLTNNTCTAIAAPAGALSVLVDVMATARSNDASGAYRYNYIDYYQNSSCNTSFENLSQAWAWEFSPLGVGTTLAAQAAEFILPVVNGYIYLFSYVDSGGHSSGTYQILGYTD